MVTVHRRERVAGESEKAGGSMTYVGWIFAWFCKLIAHIIDRFQHAAIKAQEKAESLSIDFPFSEGL